MGRVHRICYYEKDSICYRIVTASSGLLPIGTSSTSYICFDSSERFLAEHVVTDRFIGIDESKDKEQYCAAQCDWEEAMILEPPF